MLKSKGGFTLIELVMIIVILGILAAVAIPRYVDMKTQAQDATINGAFGAIGGQLQITYAQCHAYPAAADFNTSVLDRISKTKWSIANFDGSANPATFSIATVATGTTPSSSQDRFKKASFDDSTYALSLADTGATYP